MESANLAIIISMLTSAGAITWAASRAASQIKSTIDTHGNAIGELKRRLDAHDKAITEHHGRLSRLEGHDDDSHRWQHQAHLRK